MGQILDARAFQDLGGAGPFWLQEQFREIYIDSSNVFAEPDPWEVVAVTIISGIRKINQVAMTWIGFRSDK